MSGVVLRAGFLPVTTMTALDVSICLDYAHRIDPFRGLAWSEAFDRKAPELGYRDNPDVRCLCGGDVCRAECGMAKPLPAPESRPC